MSQLNKCHKHCPKFVNENCLTPLPLKMERTWNPKRVVEREIALNKMLVWGQVNVQEYIGRRTLAGRKCRFSLGSIAVSPCACPSHAVPREDVGLVINLFDCSL